ncbi:GLE1-like protein-domain-containing protein [Phlyctochytrium arcticum]|nr:GLE1-like protein-domain-containing protein [Phlyctochytrium arcticum]
MRYGYVEDSSDEDGPQPASRLQRPAKSKSQLSNRATDKFDKLQECEIIHRETSKKMPFSFRISPRKVGPTTPDRRFKWTQHSNNSPWSSEAQKSASKLFRESLSAISKDEAERNERIRKIEEAAKLKNQNDEKDIEDLTEQLRRCELEKKEKEDALRKLDAEIARIEKEAGEKAAAAAKMAREQEEQIERQNAANLAAEAQQREAAESRRQAAAEAAKAAAIPSKYMDKRVVEAAEARLQQLKDIKANLRPLMHSNRALAKTVFESKMHLTRSVGQIMNSQKKMVEIAIAVNQVLKNAQAFSQEAHILCLDYFAKAVVKQSESEVAVKVNTSFPLAILCIMILNKHQELRDIFLGRLYKRCPYIAPYYPPRLQGDSDDDFRKRLRYRTVDGEWESEIQYGERMCGVFSLYAAIMQTKTVYYDYIGMDRAWEWFACILDTPPRKITPLLILKFLEIVGHEFLQTFGRQAIKLLQFTKDQFLQKISPKAIASTTRLELFLEPIFQSGSIPSPEGRTLNP